MNGTIAWMTSRGLLGRRRFLLLLPLPIILVGLAVLTRSMGVDPAHWGPPLLVGLGFTVILPVIALIVSTAVLGAEIDDGTVVHILTKPLPRRDIVLTKLGVAVLVTALTVGIPMYVTGVLAGSVKLGLAVAAASAIGALAYGALFLALSLVTRRPVLVGLVYVLVWEGLLGNLVSGTGVLSIGQYVRTLAEKLGAGSMIQGHVSLTVSIVMASLFTVGMTVLAIDRLRSFSVAGETS
jgi:ABC-2 type transport system permease protein